jgi:hypothetical protein
MVASGGINLHCDPLTRLEYLEARKEVNVTLEEMSAKRDN